MGIYLAMYLRRVVEGSAFASSTMVALVVAVVLLVLVVVLGATSFRWVKRKMKASSWLALQRLAYVFYGLVYAHLMFMIGPSAFAGTKIKNVWFAGANPPDLVRKSGTYTFGT